MPTLSVGRASKTRGVTLVEMMIVVAIVGLIAGISFPAVSAGLDSVRLASATDSLASFLNAAVNRAERRQQPMELIISPKDNLLTLYSNEPGFTRELRLPEGIAIEAVLPRDPDDPKLGAVSFCCRAPRYRASGFRLPTAAARAGSCGLTP